MFGLFKKTPATNPWQEKLAMGETLKNLEIAIMRIETVIVSMGSPLNMARSLSVETGPVETATQAYRQKLEAMVTERARLEEMLAR